MVISGVSWLRISGFWRKTAENPPVVLPGLQESMKRGKVGLVAGPSNTKPAANCQNRYPSPSKRSAQILVRPLNFWGLVGRDMGLQKKPFAFAGETTASGDILSTKKGTEICKRNFGSLALPPSCRCLPVVTQHWNRALWAQAPGLLLRRLWVLTLLPVPHLARARMLYSVRTTQASVAKPINFRAALVRRNLCGHRGIPPVALFYARWPSLRLN